MKKHIAPEGAINRYKVTRISTGSITEVAYITAKDEDEAEEKLSNDELDSDFETMDDDMSVEEENITLCKSCLLYTSPSPRDRTRSRMPSSA